MALIAAFRRPNRWGRIRDPKGRFERPHNLKPPALPGDCYLVVREEGAKALMEILNSGGAMV
jgi:hypothetical protein